MNNTNSEELMKAFDDFLNIIRKANQEKINQEGVQETVKLVCELAEDHQEDMLKIAVRFYYSVIKGCDKQREKEFLLFIKTIIEKMIDERR